MGAVGQHAQRGKKIGPPLDFVQYNETSQGGKRQQRIGKTCEISGGLKVEKMSQTLSRPGKLTGQSRFPHLSCSHQGDDGMMGDKPFQCV